MLSSISSTKSAIDPRGISTPLISSTHTQSRGPAPTGGCGQQQCAHSTSHGSRGQHSPRDAQQYVAGDPQEPGPEPGVAHVGPKNSSTPHAKMHGFITT
jgi:hypothetical protein